MLLIEGGKLGSVGHIGGGRGYSRNHAVSVVHQPMIFVVEVDEPVLAPRQFGFRVASLGSMAAGIRSALRSVRGEGSTRKPGVVAAGAPGFDWQAGISTVGRVVGDSTTTGATSAADGPVGKAVKAAFAEGVALGRVSRGGFSSAGMAAAGTGAGTNAGTHGATGAVAEAGSVGGVRAASGVVPSGRSVTSTCSLAACSW